MNWPPDIADELPAPRDDEPSSLREDITDELADHLACAYTRELHLAKDEQSAQERALERFGDPRAVARKLWFDALRDNIMSQRLTIAALVLVTFVCIGSAGATWLLVDQVKKSNEALLAQNQEQNATLIAKLAELAAAPRAVSESTLSPEWTSVKCRLLAGGEPASGFEITITGSILEPDKEISVTRISDSSGIADIGLIRAGQHRLSVKAPWGDRREKSLITVFPGKGLIEEISCPTGRPAKTDVGFHVDFPDDLKQQDLWTVAHLKAEPAMFEGGRWFASNREDECVVVVPPDGPAILFPVTGVRSDRAAEHEMWPFETTWRANRGFRPGDTLGLTKVTGASRFTLRFAFFMSSSASTEPIRCEAGEYRLTSLLVMKPSDIPFPVEHAIPRRKLDGGNESTVKSFVVVGGIVPGAGLSSEERTMKQLTNRYFTPLADPGDDLLAPGFAAADKENNEWTIAIPPQVLGLVRTNPDFRAVAGVEKADGGQSSD